MCDTAAVGATPRKACIAGVGETRYTKWGGTTDASEYQLCCEAITAAVADAGLDLADVDGFASFAADRNEPVVLAADLGVRELRFANLVWMPGGGGPCAAVAKRGDGGGGRTGGGGGRVPRVVPRTILPPRSPAPLARERGAAARSVRDPVPTSRATSRSPSRSAC